MVSMKISASVLVKSSSFWLRGQNGGVPCQTWIFTSVLFWLFVRLFPPEKWLGGVLVVGVGSVVFCVLSSNEKRVAETVFEPKHVVTQDSYY